MDSHHESKRLAAVKSLEILDTDPESDFDDLVNLASKIFNVPISTVTILDAHRQWFKAAVGLTNKETPRDISICTHAIQQHEPLVIPDLQFDSRFSNSPLVVNAPHLAFYAGVPLRTSNDLAVGTFCIIDNKPRQLSSAELEILKVLANQAMRLLELRSERNKYQALVKEKDRINKQLEQSEQRWQFALQGSGDGVWDWDIEHNSSYFSKRWKEMLGYEDDDFISSHEDWFSLIHADDLTTVNKKLNDYLNNKIPEYMLEYRMLCKDDTYKWILTRGMVVEWDKQGAPRRMVGTHTDISNRKQTEETIWRQANFDLLTGLPNRRMFFERLKEEIKRAGRLKHLFALMFIDLDGFKEVNDNFGHKTGDDLLIQVTQRVSRCIRESDTFARLGGDEFTIILSDLEHVSAIDVVVDKILNVINMPYQLGEHRAIISASIGIAMYPTNSKGSDALMSLADSAMYEAKAKGKNCWVLAAEVSAGSKKSVANA